MTDFLELTVGKFTFRVATDRLYSPQGLWALEEVSGATPGIRLGLSDFFQQRHGDVAFAEVADEGVTLDAGDELAVIETIKVDISLPAPVAGEVVAVNPLMELEPEKINFDPYGEGWLAVVDPQNWEAARKELLTPAAYYEQIKLEAEEEVRS